MNAILEGPVNDVLASVVGEINTKQALTNSRNNRYLQALASHAETPTDGVANDTREMRKPGDQADDLGLVLPVRMPVKVSVNVYDGPLGRGYDVVAEARVGGQLHRRVITTGPEQFREQDWEEVPDEVNR